MGTSDESAKASIVSSTQPPNLMAFHRWLEVRRWLTTGLPSSVCLADSQAWRAHYLPSRARLNAAPASATEASGFDAHQLSTQAKTP